MSYYNVAIHYETLIYKGFSFGLNGLFVYQTLSNSLLAIDSTANLSSKYELQLFDIEHSGSYTDLDRLEELFIKYKTKNLDLTFGKMEIESPLAHLHDERMKPKVYSDLKLNIHHNNQHIT